MYAAIVHGALSLPAIGAHVLLKSTWGGAKLNDKGFA